MAVRQKRNSTSKKPKRDKARDSTTDISQSHAKEAAFPKVSVVIPVYNVARFLRECVDSVVGQTLSDIEIICVNDGSTDDSLSILQDYASTDCRVKIIDKCNTGYGHSMNLGFAAARGAYIGIVESDDYADLDMFETLFAIAEEHKVDVVKSNYYNYYSKKGVHSEINEYFAKEECGFTVENPRDFASGSLFYRKPNIWSAIYRTEFIRKNAIQFTETPGASFQDTAFTFKVWTTAKSAYFVHRPFLHYRQDNDSSSVNSKGKVYCVCDEYHEIEAFMQKNGLLGTHLEKIKSKAKYDTYIWNYERLADRFRYRFLVDISEEFRKARDDGALDASLYEWWKWRDINKIIDNPMAYHVFRTVERYEHQYPNNVFSPPTMGLTVIKELIKSRKTSKNHPAISVIMPVYNVEKYVKASLESVVNQTYHDIEIICVNDGSTDHSLSILEEYQKNDERIVLINKQNGGLSSARNVGIAVALGMYLVFLDSDDYLEVNACERIINIASNHPAGTPDILVFGTSAFPSDAFVADQDLRRWYEHNLLTQNQFYEKMSAQEFLKHPNTKPFVWRNSFRREFLKHNRFVFLEDVQFGEDIIFQFEVFPQANGILFTDERLYNYRCVRDGSLMSQVSRSQVVKAREHVKLVKKAFNSWKSLGLVAQAPVELFTWSVDFLSKEVQSLLPHETKALAAKAVAIWREAGLLDYTSQLTMAEQNFVADMLNARRIFGSYSPPRVSDMLWHLLKSVFPAPAESFHARLDRIEQMMEYHRQQMDTMTAQQNTDHTEALQSMQLRFDFLESLLSMRSAKLHPVRKKAIYDIGIVGFWYSCNYGSILTYYALHHVLKGMGLSVMMIEKPCLWENDRDYEDTHARRFARKNYRISERRKPEQEHELNDLCDAFIVGSDQPWNYAISVHFGFHLFLNFADENHRKIAYATSFGNEDYYGTDEYVQAARHYMGRIDAVSVTNWSSVRICDSVFGVKAKKVLDPVLLCETNVFKTLGDQSHIEPDSDYILAYILDPDESKVKIVMQAMETLSLPAEIILDGSPANFSKNKAKVNLKSVHEGVTVEDWVRYISRGSYVITDCYYGVALAIQFKKPFSVFQNTYRGDARIPELLGIFGLQDRLIQDSGLQYGNIQYSSIERKLLALREESLKWLDAKLFTEV